MQRIGNWLLIVLFISFIFGVGFVSIFSEDQSVSYYENRKLAQKPELELNKVAEGEFFEQYETYFTDQFAGREHWVRAYKSFQAANAQVNAELQNTNYQMIEGYVVTEDGWIMEGPVTYFPQQGMDEAASQMNRLASDLKAKGTELYFVLYPYKLSTVKLDGLGEEAAGMLLDNKSYLLTEVKQSQIPIIDVGQYVRDTYHQEEIQGMFFKTDHHWNMDGAFTGFQYVMNRIMEMSRHSIGPAVDKDQYMRTCIPDLDFMGSWNRKLSGIVKHVDESVCYYNPVDKAKQFSQLKVYKGAMKEEYLSRWENLYAAGVEKEGPIDFGDAYASDYRELNIINENMNAPNILILKDSYTNPIVFHFANYFHRTTIYDMRHNEDRSLVDYLEENHYDMIVIMYNEKTVSGMYSFY